jgi:hypothetical protein
LAEKLNENGGGVRREASLTSLPPPGSPAPVHYLITHQEVTGSEVPHTFRYSGGEVLAVFSFREAARRFLISRHLSDGWHVREYSSGELVSLLFAHHERLGGILRDPLPGRHLADHEDLWSPMSRDGFIEFLISG